MKTAVSSVMQSNAGMVSAACLACSKVIDFLPTAFKLDAPITRSDKHALSSELFSELLFLPAFREKGSQLVLALSA